MIDVRSNPLAASLRSLQSRLRRVPKYERGAAHQIAARHAKAAAFILPRNHAAAQEHFDIAIDAARRAGAVL